MTDYDKLVAALRTCAVYDCGQCSYDSIGSDCSVKLANDAADAIEALQSRCGVLTFKLEEAAEMLKQMPKRGEIVRCGECKHCYAEGFACVRLVCEEHPEFGMVNEDWFCADGEREVQDERTDKA